MKPALHRSLIFWAGLLVIAFTCWAWWDSCTHATGFQWKQLAASSAGHGIQISHLTSLSQPFHGRRDATGSYPAHWPHEFFPPPILVRAKETGPRDTNFVATSLRDAMQYSVDFFGPDSWSLYLPYWIILLTLLPPWSLLLLWRARRLKRASLAAS